MENCCQWNKKNEWTNKQTNEWIKDYEQTNGQKNNNERMIGLFMSML